MKFRSCFLAMGLVLLLVSTVRAQDGQNRGEPGGGNRIQRLFKNVNLTPVQRSQVDSIVQYHRSQAQRANNGAGNDAARREMLRQDIADIRPLLTRQQLEVFDRNAAAAMEQRRRD
ncbi:MAG TPA: hypothetical protein VGP80_04420 [Gemmatimonadales bacterium]|jgi:Spy/CpxP family protein refolding chaperone|nr:hypothetical protein [Gemmatimonadales bacterium]